MFMNHRISRELPLVVIFNYQSCLKLFKLNIWMSPWWLAAVQAMNHAPLSCSMLPKFDFQPFYLQKSLLSCS